MNRDHERDHDIKNNNNLQCSAVVRNNFNPPTTYSTKQHQDDATMLVDGDRRRATPGEATGLHQQA